MYVVIAGMTPEDMEWKEAALDKILEMYGGWKDERCLQPDMEEWLKTYFIRMGHKNLNYTMCGAYEGHFRSENTQSGLFRFHLRRGFRPQKGRGKERNFYGCRGR